MFYNKKLKQVNSFYGLGINSGLKQTKFINPLIRRANEINRFPGISRREWSIEEAVNRGLIPEQ